MGEGNADEAPDIGLPDVLGLCQCLNAAGVHYLLYGGVACIFHGHERVTKDIDVLLGHSPDNIQKALAALSRWGQGVARELATQDILDNVVVRLIDRCVVDLASQAWKLDWEDAWRNRRVVEVEGVPVPVLSRRDLIRSKTTYRQQDAVDIEILRVLETPEPGVPAR